MLRCEVSGRGLARVFSELENSVWFRIFGGVAGGVSRLFSIKLGDKDPKNLRESEGSVGDGALGS